MLQLCMCFWSLGGGYSEQWPTQIVAVGELKVIKNTLVIAG